MENERIESVLAGGAEALAEAVATSHHDGSLLVDAARREHGGPVGDEGGGLEDAATGPFDDPFPDLGDEVPTIEASHLTSAVVGGAIAHHGCLLVRGLFAPTVAARIREAIDRSFEDAAAWRAAREADDPLPSTPWFDPFTPIVGNEPFYLGLQRNDARFDSSVLPADSPAAFRIVTDAYRSSGLVDVLTGVFGAPPVLPMQKWVLRRLEAKVAIGWHQEIEVFKTRTAPINAWIAVAECGESAPGLSIIPRKLRGAVEPTEGEHPYRLSPATVESVVPGAPQVPLLLGAGDAILLDDLLLHRTHVTPEMTEARYSIESWFMDPARLPERFAPFGV